MSQAILEGVAYNIRDNLNALKSTGTHPKEVWAVGGGSKSVYWLKVISTVLRLPIHVPEAGDFGGAFGAARLGMMAATGAAPDQVATKPAIAHTIEPNMERAAAFDEGFDRFRALYPAIKGATE